LKTWQIARASNAGLVKAVTHTAIGRGHGKPVGHAAGVFADEVEAAALEASDRRCRTVGVGTLAVGVRRIRPLVRVAGIEDSELKMLAVDGKGIDLGTPEGVIVLV
nr:hypothetical protein [Tanacetum cinerariifolium]